MDGTDNLLSLGDAVDTGRSQTFVYDKLDRLKQAVGRYGTLDWTYDGVGNRLSEQDNNETTVKTRSYTYGSTSNRLLTVTEGTTNRILGYTAAGNTSADDRGADPDLTLSYNGANRLASIATAGVPGPVGMTYNGLGQRVVKSGLLGTALHYHYDQDGRLIAVSDATGGNWTEFVWLDDLPIAQAYGGTLYALHADHLAQPVKMTDGSGTVVWDRQLKPFGETAVSLGSVASPLRFPGQIDDPENQTSYNYFRDYDPSTGRYLQSDPIGLQGGFNTYVYSGSNPQSRFDVHGLFWGESLVGL